MNYSLPPNPASGRLRPASTALPGAKTVLVVEDDPSLRQLLTKALGATYNVYVAVDGADALDLLGAIEPPDLIVTDIMMPNLDGLMMVQRLKKFPALERVPIVFLTARGGPRDVIEGINAGARHYLTKPFKVAELIERARKILG